MVDIKRLIFDKSLNQRTIARILDCQQSEVSLFANGKRGMSDEQLQKLIDYFGKDTIEAYTLPDKPFEGISREATVTILSRETVEEVRKDIEEEIEEVESFPVLPEEVATKLGVDIREYIEESGSELERINPSRMLQHADMAERILRTSMLPTFQPDDKVFIRFIPDKAKIVDGNTYYIDSKTYPTLIRRVKFEGENKLRLIAQNRQFGDIIMDRGDILNIGTIVGLLRMNFGNQYDEIEAVRRKKDEHLERMMDMLERKEDQQSKLIDYITKQ